MNELAGHISKALYRNTLPTSLNDLNLKDYQYFTASCYINLKTFRKLLLYWDTGSGKTLETIYILKHLKEIYPKWTVFLLIKASLHFDPWMNNINEYLIEENHLNIVLLHYDDPNSYLILNKKISEIDLKTTRLIFIIDEAHNFISRSLPAQGKERYASKLYKTIKKKITDSENRLLMISATPIINHVKEFNYLTGLLRNNYEINNNNYYQEKLLCKKELINILQGCVSYYNFNDTPTLKDFDRTNMFPKKTIIIKDIYMSEYQSSIYNKALYEEIKSNVKEFRIFRRLSSTFVYQGIKVKENQNYKDYELSIKRRYEDFKNEFNNFEFSDNFITYFKNSEEDIPVFISTIMNSKEKIIDESMFVALHSYSSKYIECIKSILNSNGKCLVFEPFVTFEGVNTFKKYLDFFKIKYIEYTKDSKNRVNDVKRFNEFNNLNGELIKVCIFSSAGTEGISFKGINDLYILDIPWSDSILRQIIGRGIRLYSHIDLPIDRQYINIYIYLNYAKKNNSQEVSSVDKEMLNILIRKHNKLNDLHDVLKKVSLEYNMTKEAELVTDEYIFDKLDNEIFNFNQTINIIENKNLVSIYIMKDNIITLAFLDNKTNRIYLDKIYIGNIDKNKFEIIDNKIVFDLQ